MIKNIGKRVLAFILLFLPFQASAQDSVPTKLERYMQAQVEVNGFGGTVLILKDNTVLLKNAYGMADHEWNTPNAIDTKFSLASVSKQFTAAAVLRLVEQGKLSLDDKLSKFFPDFPKGDGVTIHMLLTHTSGLGHDFDELYMKHVGLTKDEALKLIKNKPYEFDPGARWGYSNTGYFLLACIIEKASGQSYSDFLNKYIFQPAGMKNSGVSNAEIILPKRARTYHRRENSLMNAPYINWNLNVGHDGVYSTAEDLHKWERALSGTSVLTQSSKAKMFTPYKEDYGYGLAIFPLHDHQVISHNGSFYGASTSFSVFPKDNLFITVLSNNDSGANRVAYALSAIVFNIPVELPYKHVEIKIDTALYDVYAGKYGEHEIVNTGGKLIYKNSNSELRPESTTKFFFADNPSRTIEFVANRSGAIDSLVLTISGVKKTVPRNR